MIQTNIFRKYKKETAKFFIFLFIFELGSQASFAVPHGPDSPEMGGFTPIEITDYVNKFTGDFNYNIPLFEIGGYPINLAYSTSGISNEAEASWVGLGWSLNPGAINRSMRGLPDEFNAKNDFVEQKDRMTPMQKYNLGLSAGHIEFVGLDIPPFMKDVDLSLYMNTFYNTYSGLGFDFGAGASITPSSDYFVSKIIKSANIGINLSTESGITFTPGVSIRGLNLPYVGELGGHSLQTTYNSRTGLGEVQTTMATNNIHKAKAVFAVLKDFNGLSSIRNMRVSNARTFNIGNRTYIPNGYLPSKSLSLSGSYAFGVEMWWVNFGLQINGSYLKQSIPGDDDGHVLTRKLKPYGYWNYREQLHYNKANAIYDFNQENDVELDGLTPNYNLAFMTYDMFNVNAQGISGSYRAHRNGVSIVSEGIVNQNGNNENSSVTSANLGLEVGGLNTFKGAVNVGVQFADGHYGGWNKDNLPIFDKMAGPLKSAFSDYGHYHPIMFKQIGSKSVVDIEVYKSLFKEDAIKLPLSDKINDEFLNIFTEYNQLKGKVSIKGQIANNKDQSNPISNGRYNSRVFSAELQPFTVLTAREAEAMTCRPGMQYTEYDGRNLNNDSVDFVRLGYADNQAFKKENHISEINVLRPDGMRYVFGLPSYNLVHKEVSYNITNGGNDGHLVNNTDLGKYGLDENHAGVPEERGKTGFLNAKTYSPYAHSFHLTCVLSSDYFDIDGNGPSVTDQGNYVNFDYVNWFGQEKPYKWKTPHARMETQENKHRYGNLDEGIASVYNDDRGSYSYGEKEIWYARKIESKEHVALFHMSESESKHTTTLNSEHGLYSQYDNVRGTYEQENLAKLDSIQVFTREEFDKTSGIKVPEKTIHFRYDYELAQMNIADKKSGKLTLKRLFYTYKKSEKSAFNGYQFTYGDNPTYAGYKRDRWGNYQHGDAPDMRAAIENRPISNMEYPFTKQNNRQVADINASAWHLNAIKMPTGGNMQIAYEADDYGFVQAKRAGIAYQILGFANSPEGTIKTSLYDNGYNDLTNNNYLFVDINQIHNQTNNQLTAEEYWNEAVKNMSDIPIRCLVDISSDGDYEFVKGYIDISEFGVNSDGLGYVKLVPKYLKKNGHKKVNPITKIALQEARQKFYNKIYKGDANPSKGLLNVMRSLIGFATDIRSIMKGQERVLIEKRYGRVVKPNRSHIVLKDPYAKKIGGGSRVKKILVSDKWQDMAGAAHTSNINGWEYEYTTKIDMQNKWVEVSSGVAAWEPELGSIENLNLKPDNFNEERMLAPSNSYFQLRPLGKSVYPSPTVGYSCVTVKNIVPLNENGLSALPLGKIDYTFFTAKDFPTRVENTQPDFVKIPMNEGDRPLFNFFGENTFYGGAATQGFAIILNDMHGKPNTEKHYRNKQTAPYKSITYEYQTTDKVLGNGQTVMDLDNNVSTIYKGLKSKNLVGVEVDLTINTKEYFRVTRNIPLDLNLDITVIGFGIGFPIPIPSIYASLSSESVFARSITATKVVNKYGILKGVTTITDGAKSIERNLMYDRITTAPLLIESINQFNDPIYKLTYPAYWFYPEFSPRSYRDRVVIDNLVIMDGVVTSGEGLLSGDVVFGEVVPSVYEAFQIYYDEVDFKFKAVALNINSSVNIKSGYYNFEATIFAEGNKNMLEQRVGEVICKDLPFNERIIGFIGVKVLDASFNTFKKYELPDEDCACDFYEGYNEDLKNIIPHYRWYPETSYVLKDNRTYSGSDDNHKFNIRHDGYYENFAPFWTLQGSSWRPNTTHWIFGEKITHVNSFGKPTQTEDALNRNSAYYWGFNQSQLRATTFNAKQGESFVEDFETQESENCLDQNKVYGARNISDQGHTGFGALKVKSRKEIIIKGTVKQ
jgi:hypothetical protein